MDEDEELADLPVADTDTTCPECYAEFLDPGDLEVHINQMHKPKGRKCHFCSDRYTSIDEYAKHIIENHIINLRSCSYCLRIFSDADIARKHAKKHIKSTKNKFFCSHCKENFENTYELQVHEENYHSGSLESTGVFLKDTLTFLSSYLNIEALTFIQSLGKQSSYTCQKCKLTTPSPNDYINHLKKRKCKSFTCQRCCKVYRTKKTLIRHLNHHGECHLTFKNEDIKKQCMKCHKDFNIFVYNDHTKSCEAVSCNMCQMTLANMYELSQHQTKNHPMAISMTICNFCRREFVGSVALQKHIDRTHRNDFHLYKYTCVYCEETYFKHPKNLFGHFFSKHNDLQPYSCKICNLTFRPRKKFTLHIKLQHNSVGFVEFDEKYHVFFTDKKSEKPFVPKSFFADQIKNDKSNDTDGEAILATDAETDAPDVPTDAPTDVQTDAQTDIEETKSKDRKPPKIRFKEQRKEEKIKQDNLETDDNVDATTAKTNKKRKKGNKTKKEYVTDNSDDEPLSKIRKPMKFRNRSKKLQTKSRKQFTCNLCKKYCYTYLNYNRHMSLHFENEKKTCIKCSKEFTSKTELNKHITEVHSKSQLTETLKSLLMRRKSGITANDVTAAEKFRRTIKKVVCDTQAVTATIKTSEDLSVQKFIESFTPEETAKKTPEIKSSVSIKALKKVDAKPPVIKLTKYKPKPFPKSFKLAMPVHFKDINSEKTKVNVKIVQNPQAVKIVRNFPQENMTMNDYEDFDQGDDITHYEEVSEKNENVPDVAEEVMLQESQDDKFVPPAMPVHHIILPKLPENMKKNDIRIAHLAPEAPYYKIVKMKDVLKNSEVSLKQEVVEPDEDVKLPFGTKLVNVNPLAHLIGNTPVEKIVGNSKGKKKPENFEKAIAKALLKLETVVSKKSRKKKGDKLKEEESNA